MKCSRWATLQQLMANVRAAPAAVEPASEQSGDTAGLRPPQRHVAITFRDESLPFPPLTRGSLAYLRPYRLKNMANMRQIKELTR